LVRDLGNALRDKKEVLSDLVSLETGKIRVEGHGEVQEMIDICDFAVGLSRQLYGLTMHSERPGHRMYEQWHPLGPIGVITAFNFPVAVWSWNAAIAAVCGDTVVWKPSELAPLCGLAVQRIANQIMADHGVWGVFNLVVGGADTGQMLLEDDRLPLISFTGSTRVGRHVPRRSNWAATMPSSWTRAPTWNWLYAPSYLGRWALPGSAAPAPGALLLTSV
jgi:aldehyde dehydrogenase (NAD+)